MTVIKTVTEIKKEHIINLTHFQRLDEIAICLGLVFINAVICQWTLSFQFFG